MHPLGAALAKREIVFARAPLVGVTFDGEAIFVVLIKPRRLLVERRLGSRGEIGLISVEENTVADGLIEFLHADGIRRAIASGEVVGVVVRAGSHCQAKGERRSQCNRLRLR